jgi:hypothetical protein
MILSCYSWKRIPLMWPVAGGVAAVCETPEQFKEKQDIDVLVEHRVTQIDPTARRLEVFNMTRGSS